MSVGELRKVSKYARWRMKNPEKVKAQKARYREKHRDKLREKWKAYYHKNKERRLAQNRERYYSLSKEQRSRMRHRGRKMPEPTRPCPDTCEACGSSPNGHGALHLDHCHLTGEFRGWICARCNVGIGMLGDRLEVVEMAAAYLRRVASGDLDAKATEPRSQPRQE